MWNTNRERIFTVYNPTSDSDAIIVYINFSQQNSYVLKACFTPALGS